jgi:hypothetical protein
MKRVDAKEAAEIVGRMMENLVWTVPSQGRPGSDARTAINDVRANAFTLLMEDALGQPLADAFDSAFDAGCQLTAIATVRQQIELEKPRTPGAILVRDVGINFCLAITGKVIAAMNFVSRQDVDNLKLAVKGPFAEAEEIAADAMDSATYQALIGLHAAISNHLVQTALPLPRMLGYIFFEPLPSLVVAYRLYGDAGRADEVRNENKIVHPAFCPPLGKALAV